MARLSGSGVRRRPARAAAMLIGVAVLLLPSAHAVAANDPDPVQWPKIPRPDAGGDGPDPAPIKWPAIDRPDTGSSADPAPIKWQIVEKPT